MEQIPEFKSETNEARMKRMLGLRDFPKREPEEKRVLLQSDQRLAALESITTTTMPFSKKEIKKGAVLEIAEKGLVSPEILKHHALVYIGSGTDIEYPLALGGREIDLVDPIFSDPRAREELNIKIKKLIADNPATDGDILNFKFDFGGGKEDVSVHLITKPFPYSEEKRNGEDYIIPEETGAIILFASQGPSGLVKSSESMREKLTEGGIIIEDHTVITKNGESIELGT